MNNLFKKNCFFSIALLVLMVILIPEKTNADLSPPMDTFILTPHSLPGKLNQIPVFNSNSPEVVTTEGILLSTFPPDDKVYQDAHLNRAFQGKFDIFTHHIAVEREKGDLTTLYEGIILKNASNKTVRLKILSSATYNSQPDSPFIKLPDLIENNDGSIFAGPGDRVSQDILRNKSFMKNKVIIIRPDETIVLMNESIPIYYLVPPVNGRTSLFKLESNGPLYIADLALYEKKCLFSVKKPELSDWLNILKKGKLSEKRDKIPTPIDKPKPKGQPFIYGRVSGVATGNTWTGKIVNDINSFNIPESGTGDSFVLNTVYANTFGTEQIQSALMEKRYPDTAYQAHANYGIIYELEIPLFNNFPDKKEISVSFDTPLRNVGKNDPYVMNLAQVMYFNKFPPEKIFFRGEFKIQYKEENITKEKYIHVVQRIGEKGQPLLKLVLEPDQKKVINISYIYPADSTPPHVLTIFTN